MRAQPNLIRETAGVDCPRCGRDRAGWEHGIPIDEFVVAIVADPGLLKAMDSSSCPGCGGPNDWDAVTASNGDRAAGAGGGVRRATLTLIRAQLALGRRPDAIASWIRSEVGVVGIVVEGSSPIGRRLAPDLSGRPQDRVRGR
jgi:hypothetical protein